MPLAHKKIQEKLANFGTGEFHLYGHFRLPLYVARCMINAM